ncbi:MAG: helix-turn-helix transcriptional regulator [Acholeplasmataceae bacterium]|nr:helix-turn-helix transcriptional regulator [Acholeplasmataceae bacterium]
MQSNQTLSKYLKQLRLNHNDERLIDMASKLDISQSFLSAIESGKRNLSDKLVNKIVKAYRLNDEELNQLIHLRDLASNKLHIDFDNFENEQKEVVVQFLSNVKDLDKKSLKKINLIIEENKNDSHK